MLKSNPKLLEDYDNTFKEQKRQGIIEEVTDDLSKGSILHYIPHQPVLTPHKETTNVLNMLKSNPKLLEDYDNTFKEQKRQGIIEVVTDDLSKGSIPHYIPHQPVLTPHKETTKLRIVFDASSHYKDCPSLNDVLHQGPLILPDLYGLLIRFRTSPYVAISDVEKAFLQVRLNEQDRDATRFLWLRNLHEPVTESNIISLRFTRVTFGLNVSPFLLAATIYHHLDYAVDDKELAQQIRDNLYVDNLILAAEDPKELGRKAAAARQIFNDMRMNLREFLSNTGSLQHFIPTQALGKSTTQKVLGVTWDAVQDCLKMKISFSAENLVTKRLIARQIASIFDPLGWMVPLLTPAKHFQQQLWKQKLEWDTQLPKNLCNDWQNLVDNADGFEHVFPRSFRINVERSKLAVFADASDKAMATCAYLFDGSEASLVMARCKLPSIRSTTTIPKLEMNAITMATRLALSVYRALEKSKQTPKEIIIFSDSQIALSWLAIPLTTSNAGLLVRNRVKEIRSIVNTLNESGVPVRFAHMSTQENPSDAGTRGLTREQLQNH
ncbi:unnamed protein product, partial [Nippostrongylus brasiliensis]|uniref:RNase H domain-containing protein n=1 Tax=Nippostrongylus brasiliensis TaxID=27835 RepID=A0A0N4YQC6_NIPBR